MLLEAGLNEDLPEPLDVVNRLNLAEVGEIDRIATLGSHIGAAPERSSLLCAGLLRITYGHPGGLIANLEPEGSSGILPNYKLQSGSPS
ncbi:hypothetical protein D3C77_474360 [compost metagenome]